MRELREDALPVLLHGTVAVDGLAAGNADVENISDVQAVLELTLASRVCRVTGPLRAPVVYRCARCLTTFSATLAAHLDELFTEWPVEAGEDIHLVKTEWVVLDEYVMESMQLALEYRPLCSVACKGLCPDCGQDLNTVTCNCAREPFDPRLEALKDLLSADDSE